MPGLLVWSVASFLTPEANLLVSTRVILWPAQYGYARVYPETDSTLGAAMDVVMAVGKTVLTLAFLVLVIGLTAALFMIVFGVATGIDDRMVD